MVQHALGCGTQRPTVDRNLNVVTPPGNAQVFGDRTPNVIYVRRPSAYAVIRNESRDIAVVRTAQGVFLPGGGLQEGETPESAVHREVLEEIGLTIHLVSRLPDAVQLIYSRGELQYFEKASAFFIAATTGAPHGKPEAGHELLWLDPAGAMSHLAHESHKWACSIASSDYDYGGRQEG